MQIHTSTWVLHSHKNSSLDDGVWIASVNTLFNLAKKKFYWQSRNFAEKSSPFWNVKFGC